MHNYYLSIKNEKKSPLDVYHEIGLRSCTTEEHLARIRRGQRVEIIIDLTFQKSISASLTDACPAAKVRKDAMFLSEIEQILRFGVPLSGDLRL
jgi:hypothetical protein